MLLGPWHGMGTRLELDTWRPVRGGLRLRAGFSANSRGRSPGQPGSSTSLWLRPLPLPSGRWGPWPLTRAFFDRHDPPVSPVAPIDPPRACAGPAPDSRQRCRRPPAAAARPPQVGNARCAAGTAARTVWDGFNIRHGANLAEAGRRSLRRRPWQGPGAPGPPVVSRATTAADGDGTQGRWQGMAAASEARLPDRRTPPRRACTCAVAGRAGTLASPRLRSWRFPQTARSGAASASPASAARGPRGQGPGGQGATGPGLRGRCSPGQGRMAVQANQLFK